jgi:transposase InsO family protein
MTAFIDEHRGRFGVEPVCRVLEVSVSAYYARKTRPPSRRARGDAELLERIRVVHERNYRSYGSRRIWKALHREGVRVGRCRVERLMRAHGLSSVRRGKRGQTTNADPAGARPADLVERRFQAERPNELWVADISYVRSFEGMSYFAFVLDVYSRMIVGWQLASTLRTDLVLDALEMAVWQRDLRRDRLIHHSDRGSQYTSFRYSERLAELGITASVGSVADAYDNAMAESFVATFKNELVRQRRFRSRDQAELAVVEWIGWYNHARLHSALDDLPPTEYEMISSDNNTSTASR